MDGVEDTFGGHVFGGALCAHEFGQMSFVDDFKSHE